MDEAIMSSTGGEETPSPQSVGDDETASNLQSGISTEPRLPSGMEDDNILCSAAGIRNVSCLVNILKEDLDRSVRKTKQHSVVLLDIIYCRIYRRRLADAFFTLDNLRYLSQGFNRNRYLLMSHYNQFRRGSSKGVRATIGSGIA
eukprot:Gregarina_sp_Poly_1__3608@NODE_205_length_11479_cov_138_250613_g183_i0_p6_GENE_NODE_205_length_11479_cov_138_250613_g183_i0NODE_205_length_11479_cov_138_250613_g183_i0_p6_ORF_typecomplete_len145_score15_00_NODE_205_length_11479_cov_138_250613_g183_i083308764